MATQLIEFAAEITANAVLATAAKPIESAALDFAGPGVERMSPKRHVTLVFPDETTARAFLAAVQGTQPAASAPAQPGIDGIRVSPPGSRW